MLENIRLSFNGIKTHKLRSFLTMLGVIIGIASIIAIVSIVHGTNVNLEKSLIGSGNNVTNIILSRDGEEYEVTYEGIPAGIPTVSEDTLSRITSLDHVVGAADYLSRSTYADVFYGSASMGNGRVVGVKHDYFKTLSYELVSGRIFTEDEIASGKKVAVLDKSSKEKLFEGEDPVGKIIEIKEEPFVIVGVVKAKGEKEADYESIDDYYTYAYNSDSTNVFVPQKVWPVIYAFDEPQNVAVQVDEAANIATAGKATADILNESVSNESITYSAKNSAEDADELKTLTNSIQMMLLSIASLSLLVGGIGVMNIMLVSVSERTSEIGLKKALGAKHRNILAQFLTESAVLTSVGGMIGVVVGIIMAKIISYVTEMEFGVSIPWIIISVAFSIFIGVLFGAVPASRAAKMDPIEALRRD